MTNEQINKDWKDQFRVVEGSRWTFPSEVRISWSALKELVESQSVQAQQEAVKFALDKVVSEAWKCRFEDVQEQRVYVSHGDLRSIVNEIKEALKGE